MQQLSAEIGAHRKPAVPQKGQNLTVDGQSRPAQHKGGHGQSSGDSSPGQGGNAGGQLDHPGQQPSGPNAVHPQGAEQKGQHFRRQIQGAA